MLSALKALAALIAAGIALLWLYVLILIPFTPSISDIRKARLDQPSVLLSADGKRLGTYNRLNRRWVELEQVSPHVVRALIATEDHRFYQHHGLDFRRIAGAALRTVAGDAQGGSTLTQQLARNLFPDEIGRERTLTRKIREIITALKIENTYSKQEILVTYLNTVPFLYNAFGIEMAARTYFDKPASRLDVLESATLVGMLKGTSFYNPVLNPERAVKRRNLVLSQMRKHNALGEASFAALAGRPIRLSFERQPEPVGPAPHFAEHVRKWLVEWADRNSYNIYQDGLMVHATVDSRVQAAANQAVARQMDALQTVADVEWGLRGERLISTSAGAYAAMRRRVQPFGYFWASHRNLVDSFIRESLQYRKTVDSGVAAETALERLRKDAGFIAALRADKTRLQAGFVAIDPATGQVKGWVGSRDFSADQYDHVARAQRQPGSTFKPFIYGAALEQGISPDSRFVDQAVAIPMPDGSVWRPADVSPPSGKQMTLAEGLIQSKNTITAQVMQQVGPGKAIDVARRMGVNQSRLDPVPALALGTSPVTPLEMVSGYATIASGGDYRAPLFVSRITDKNGKLLADFESRAKRALPRGSADDLLDMLRGAIDRGTGQAVRSQFGIRADVAGKTGTTQDNADGWFILMHPRLVAGAWVGFNDPRVTLRSTYWGQGAHSALPVVADFFRQTLHSRWLDPGARFPGTEDLVLESLIERIKAWLGWDDPPSPQREQSSDSPLGVPDRIAGRVREALNVYDRLRRWLGAAGGERGSGIESSPQIRKEDSPPPPEAQRRQRDRAQWQRESEERLRNAP